VFGEHAGGDREQLAPCRLPAGDVLVRSVHPGSKAIDKPTDGLFL
jgi:hypothetical protein